MTVIVADYLRFFLSIQVEEVTCSAITTSVGNEEAPYCQVAIYYMKV